jgi:hypothetical protein
MSTATERLAAKLKLLTDACGRVTAAEFQALAALLLIFHNTESGRCFPNDATLGEAIGKSERTVGDSTRSLQANGWLTKKPSRGASRYSFPGVEGRQFSADLKEGRQLLAIRSAVFRKKVGNVLAEQNL